MLSSHSIPLSPRRIPAWPSVFRLPLRRCLFPLEIGLRLTESCQLHGVNITSEAGLSPSVVEVFIAGRRKPHQANARVGGKRWRVAARNRETCSLEVNRKRGSCCLCTRVSICSQVSIFIQALRLFESLPFGDTEKQRFVIEYVHFHCRSC